MKKPVKSRSFCKISGCRGDAVHSGGHCDTHLRALRKKRIKRRQQHTYFSPRHRKRRLFGAKKAPNPPSKMRGSRRALQRRAQEARRRAGWPRPPRKPLSPEMELQRKVFEQMVASGAPRRAPTVEALNELTRLPPSGETGLPQGWEMLTYALAARVPGVEFPITFSDWTAAPTERFEKELQLAIRDGARNVAAGIVEPLREELLKAFGFLREGRKVLRHTFHVTLDGHDPVSAWVQEQPDQKNYTVFVQRQHTIEV